MKSLSATVVKAFVPPCKGANLVVFSSDEDYLEREACIQHLLSCIKYAKKYNCYTVPSRFLKEKMLTLCMISPQGEIVGSQAATHLHINSRGKVKQGGEIAVIKTPLANFFLASGTDIFHPEVIRYASFMGAEVIISSRFMRQTDDLCYRVCSGAENAAISNGVYVLDVTEEGGHFIDPWSNNPCIRTQKQMGAMGIPWEFSLDPLRNDPARPILRADPPLYHQYRESLER